MDKGNTFVRNAWHCLPSDAALHSRRKECSNAVSFVQCCTQNHAEVSQGTQNVPVRNAHPTLPERLLCNPTTVATGLPCGLPLGIAAACGLTVQSPHSMHRHLGQASCTVCFTEQKSAFAQAGCLLLRYEPKREHERAAEENCLVRLCMIAHCWGDTLWVTMLCFK